MFKSPFSSLMSEEDKKAPKAEAGSKGSKSSKHEPEHDDIAKSVTVHQHHDGHYSTEHHDTGETHDHDNLDDVKDHLDKEFEGDGQDDDEAEEPARHESMGSMKGMY